MYGKGSKDDAVKHSGWITPVVTGLIVAGALFYVKQSETKLVAQIEQLRQQQQPIAIDVDCNTGGSIMKILAELPLVPVKATITISGICEESVVVKRDDVTFKGKTETDGIKGNIALLVTAGSSRVNVDSLTLQGKFAGLICSYGSSVVASNIRVSNSFRGVSAFYNGSCAIEDSVISKNRQGLVAGDSGNIRVRGSVIEKSGVGASVFANGALTLDKSDANEMTIVRHNFVGVDVSTNGSLRPVNVKIEQNKTDGLVIKEGGSVYVADRYVTVIQNNGGNGVDLGEFTKLSLTAQFKVLNNQGYGINCSDKSTLQTKKSTPESVNENQLSNFAEQCRVVF
jgi:hypothetical protein